MTDRLAPAAVALALLLAPATAPAAEFHEPPQADTVPSTGTFLTTPIVGLSATGDAVAVWADITDNDNDAGTTDDDMEAAVRPAGGAWTQLPEIDANTAPTQASLIELGVEADGDATVAWRDPIINQVFTAFRPAGAAAFGAALPVSPLGVNDMRMAVAPDGRAVIAWITNGDRKVQAVYRAPGASAFADGGDAGSEPDIDIVSADTALNRNSTTTAITSTGRVIVVWQDASADDITMAVRDPGDSAFDNELDVQTPASDDVFSPQIATDGQGGAVVDYFESTGGNRTLRSTTLTPGTTTWSAPVTLYGTDPTSFEHDLALAPDGTAYAIWTLSGGSTRIARRPAGGGWTPAGGESVAASNTDSPAIAAAPDGTAIAAWREKTDFRLLGTEVTPAGGAGAVRFLSPTPDSNGAPHLAHDPDGDVLVGYRDAGPAPDRIRAAYGDAAFPDLALTAPASLQAGEAGDFSLIASDFSGIGSTAFDFGDGTTAPGPAATHAYAAPGRYTVTATATDAFGRQTVETAGIVVPDPAGDGTAPQGGDAQGGDTPAVPTTGARTRPPDSAITRPGRRVKRKRLRALRGTASDELGVRRVEVALIRLRGGARLRATTAARRRCQSLTAAGRLRRQAISRGRCRATRFVRATGTTSWQLRLKRRLPRGRYVAVSRAIGIDGAVEQGFSRADGNLVRFRVVR